MIDLYITISSLFNMRKSLYNLKKIAKRNSWIVKIYNKILGYNPDANQWCRIVMDNETKLLISQLPFQTF